MKSFVLRALPFVGLALFMTVLVGGIAVAFQRFASLHDETPLDGEPEEFPAPEIET